MENRRSQGEPSAALYRRGAQRVCLPEVGLFGRQLDDVRGALAADNMQQLGRAPTDRRLWMHRLPRLGRRAALSKLMHVEGQCIFRSPHCTIPKA